MEEKTLRVTCSSGDGNLASCPRFMAALAKKVFLSDLLRIMGLLPHPLRWRIYGLFSLMFIVAILEVLSICSMTFTAMSVAAPKLLMEDPTMQSVLEFFPALAKLCEDPRYFTLVASLGVVILTVIKNIFTPILFWKQALLSEDVASYAGDTIMSNYLHNSYMWHISNDSSTTMMALGARQSLSALLMQILNVYTYTIISVALVCVLVAATPLVLIAILVVTGMLSWAVYSSMKRALDTSGQIAVDSSRQETVTRNNAMHGIREVLIYRQQPIFLQKFRDACAFGLRARSFLSMAPPIPTWILEIYGFAAIPFTTWVLIRYYDADMVMIAGVVTMVMLAAWRILPMLNRSLSCLVVVRSCRPMAMVCLERLEQIEKMHMAHQADPDENFQFKREIALENVDFRYPDADRLALDNVSCTIRKGLQVGLVGLSGSGKSTLAGILAGLLEPESGHFLVDGHELDPAQLSAYRSKIGYVPQTPYLLAGTIAENVAFSQWGKPYDEEAVRAACAMAALDVVEDEERGIEYTLGENGSGLSGGQAQRVAIARALYAKPEILILDESTSALDQQTEAAIMDTIDKLKDKLTMIIIAHRLTTVEHCDWLIWLEEGRVRQQGPADMILAEYRESMRN